MGKGLNNLINQKKYNSLNDGQKNTSKQTKNRSILPTRMRSVQPIPSPRQTVAINENKSHNSTNLFKSKKFKSDTNLVIYDSRNKISNEVLNRSDIVDKNNCYYHNSQTEWIESGKSKLGIKFDRQDIKKYNFFLIKSFFINIDFYLNTYFLIIVNLN